MSYSQRVVEWQKGYDGLSYSPGKPSSHKVIGRKVIAYPTTGHLWRGLKLKFIKDSYLEYVKNEKRIREI